MDARRTGALFSPCRRFRYLLWRTWSSEDPACLFIGLNPSTADELQDDPTIRRCRGFAESWGFGALWMANVFAFRSTMPAALRQQGGSAIGPRNDEYLLAASRAAGRVICAWGTHAKLLGRGATVARMLREGGVTPHVLRLTQEGYPGHPLYLPKTLEPVAWLGPYR